MKVSGSKATATVPSRQCRRRRWTTRPSGASERRWVAMGGRAAAGQFGSSWAWLVAEGDKLAITTTANADFPLAQDKQALLTCDTWEHAYYLDYQNRRPDYLTAFLDNLVNWEFAEKNLG